jgi:glycerophosphoryl diester phosphodiesterase
MFSLVPKLFSKRAQSRLLLILLGSTAIVWAGNPVVIAHRGASGYLPEHTLAAKALAHGQGADFLEQDLVLSKDNVPVVLHDIHLEAVTDVAEKFPDRKRADGRFYAIDFTIAELKQLRVSERFDPNSKQAVFPKRFPVGTSTFQIATFEEELQLIQGLNRSSGKQVGIYPEIKSPAWHRHEGRDLSRIALDVLERYGYRSKEDAMILQCFEFDEVKRLRAELGYRGRLVQLLGDDASGRKLCAPEGLAEVARYADGIGPALSLIVTANPSGGYRVSDLVSRAHAAGLLVHPYTFRADQLPAYAESFEALHRIFFDTARVDGVFTDFPNQTVGFLRSNTAQTPQIVPLLRAHAHNDYEHARPLFDALEQGFCSIEADIWLVDGQLLVAHNRDEVKHGRTLQSLYLDPLREQARRNGGWVCAGTSNLTLLVDVKSDALETYKVLRDVLANYADLLTEFSDNFVRTRAVTVILSGQRATSQIAAEPRRFVAVDGRLADLDTKIAPTLVPLISDNWSQFFAWRGSGEFSAAERSKLQSLVLRAHEQGRRLRFWGCPDNEAVWRELAAAGVDLIGADDLPALRSFWEKQGSESY